MEYFNFTDYAYFQYLQSARHKMLKVKIELLSDFENVVGDITKYFCKETDGQININYQQLVRRSCSITLMNVEEAYRNISFWSERKFKLWIGAIIGDDTYWFSFGIYLTKSVKVSNHDLSIEAVDKGGILDGTLKTNMMASQVLIEKGSSIAQFFRDTLLLSENYFITDPVPPIIDRAFERAKIETDVSINRGEYVGKMFETVANAYGADIYYDVDGRFTVNILTGGNRGDGYNLLPSLFDFTSANMKWIDPNIDYENDYVNSVTVFTNISAKNSKGEEIPNVSYTAYNNNPLSPLRISATRIRQIEPQEIAYINVLPNRMERICKEYANYLLFKNSMIAMSVSFTSQIMPHLDVDKIITITDETKGLSAARFVIQSLTIPLSANEMSIQCTNTQTLPIDTNMEGGIYGRIH